MDLEDQVIALFASVNGFADKINLDRVKEWQESLLRYMENTNPKIQKDIASKKRISEETEKKLREVIPVFNSTWK
jgi:F-type H+-transporting ATPase subunit alpha